MNNPYEPPPTDLPPSETQKEMTLPPPQEPGLVGHVRVIAILMMVQGALEMVMGLFLATFAILFPSLQSIMEEQGQPGVPPEGAIWFMIGLYGGIGLVHLCAGVLHAYAGYRNYAFKGRTLGIVALSSGVLTIFGCYCLPTAVALSVYGLIVYLNGSVARAFIMGEEGFPGDAVLVTFSRYRTAVNDPFSAAGSPSENPFQRPKE